MDEFGKRLEAIAHNRILIEWYTDFNGSLGGVMVRSDQIIIL